MVFSWLNFVHAYGIDYIETGKNVQRGCIAINCPLCAGADPSYHCNVSLTGPEWRCWRNPAHRGYRPARLIQALRRCNWAEAVAAAGAGVECPLGPLETLTAQAAALWGNLPPPAPAGPVAPPVCFRPFPAAGPAAIFTDYLAARGFPRRDIADLAVTYDLRYSLAGPFRRRLILPFLYRGAWRGWTARAVGPAELRYISYPDSAAVKAQLFNYDNAARGGETLVIVEGAIGALKVDYYGKGAGIRAAATLGTTASAAQCGQIIELSARYARTLVAFDPGAEGAALRLAGRVSAAVGFLPPGLSGPDDLAPAAVVPAVRAMLTA